MTGLGLRVEIKLRRWLHRAERLRRMGKRRIGTTRKLDESKVKWIIEKKREGNMTNAQIAESMNVSVIWVKKLWSRYRNCTGTITYPLKMGRPENGLPGRREHSAVLSALGRHRRGAVRVEKSIEQDIGIHIPHNTIHDIIKENGLTKRSQEGSEAQADPP